MYLIRNTTVLENILRRTVRRRTVLFKTTDREREKLRSARYGTVSLVSILRVLSIRNKSITFDEHVTNTRAGSILRDADETNRPFVSGPGNVFGQNTGVRPFANEHRDGRTTDAQQVETADTSNRVPTTVFL